jgi:hypothetical protein
MKLLEQSIQEDGYTQPIVSWQREDGMKEVVDGFHRHRVGKESKTVRERIHGYLPCVVMNDDRLDKTDRMASTIRHNRARGKHKVEAMSDIVIELKRRNWSDEKIAKNLGMDPDEILRLTQITGLAEMFQDSEFSASWDLESAIEEDAVEVDAEADERNEKDRIYHTFDKWECYKAGFYENSISGKTKEECEQIYAEFLRDEGRFKSALQRVLKEWPMSCEHYLSNENMNRIAWLGQASLCIAEGIPSAFRGGFNLLSEDEQRRANGVALEALNQWLVSRGKQALTMEDAEPKTKANLY